MLFAGRGYVTQIVGKVLKLPLYVKNIKVVYILPVFCKKSINCYNVYYILSDKEKFRYRTDILSLFPPLQRTY